MVSQADKLLKKAFTNYKKKHKNFGEHVSVRKIADECNLPYTSVYNTLLKKRKCNAQIWLRIMECLGAVEIRENSIVMSGNEAFVSQGLSQSLSKIL